MACSYTARSIAKFRNDSKTDRHGDAFHRGIEVRCLQQTSNACDELRARTLHVLAESECEVDETRPLVLLDLAAPNACIAPDLDLLKIIGGQRAATLSKAANSLIAVPIVSLGQNANR